MTPESIAAIRQNVGLAQSVGFFEGIDAAVAYHELAAEKLAGSTSASEKQERAWHRASAVALMRIAAAKDV